MLNTVKRCKTCSVEKDIGCFQRHGGMKDGYLNFCKLCCAKKAKKNYLIKRDDRLAYLKKWRTENKKSKSDSDKEYQRKNKEKLSAKKREYYQKNKEQLNIQAKKRRETDYARSLRNKRHRERFKEDIGYRLSHNMRCRFLKAIKNNQKTGSAIEALGCSIDELRAHLESGFQEGMSWNNYGIKPSEWSIDHIVPLSKVDLGKREEFLKVSHYTNLRPLWHIENMRKGNKI